MAWEDLKAGLSGATTLFSGIGSYLADRRKAAAARSWQEYNNTIVNLSAALNQRAITQNEIIATASAQQDKFDIQKQGLITAARVEVAAAAAGVKGNSVNLTLLDAQRTAAINESRRQMSLNNAMAVFQSQHENVEIQRVTQQDYSYVENPSLASAVLNTVTRLNKSGVIDYFSGDNKKKGSGGSLSTGGKSFF